MLRMHTATPTRRLADTLLEGSLDEFVAARREQGKSWRIISRELYAATKLDVTHETLRSWYRVRAS